jgi:hypothetical protein
MLAHSVPSGDTPDETEATVARCLEVQADDRAGEGAAGAAHGRGGEVAACRLRRFRAFMCSRNAVCP